MSQSGKTLTIAKVLAHVGDPMNEKADTLANKLAQLPPEMHFMTLSHECLFSIIETQPRTWSPRLSRRLVQHLAMQRWATQSKVASQPGNLTERWL